MLYSDSCVTLQRIKQNPNQYETFEMNRLQQILELSKPTQWHYIPTTANPADLLTRDNTVNKWLNSPLWWNGPTNKQYILVNPMHKDNYVCMTIQLKEEEKQLLTMKWQEVVAKLSKQFN